MCKSVVLSCFTYLSFWVVFFVAWVERVNVFDYHFLWPYLGGNLTFLGELILRNIKTNLKSKTHTKVYLECLLRPVVLCVLCCSMCLFLYGPFCHGAIKLDQSRLFTTFLFEHIFNLYYTIRAYCDKLGLVVIEHKKLFWGIYIFAKYDMQHLGSQKLSFIR